MTITPTTTVRDLLQAHPQAFAVFERHGMCSDCRAAPPPVPLQQFATKHCNGDIAGLLSELRAAIAGGLPGPTPSID
jgi:hypothetical protein